MRWLWALALLLGCSDAEPEPELRFVAMTFNTGTSEALPHDSPPADGYTSDDALTSDTWYGDGLAWQPAVDATQQFFARVSPDVVGFQEIFYSGECADIPVDARDGFVCETWSAGDATVAQVILGEGYQVACHLGKSDKCAAVKRSFGTFRGCDSGLCLDGLDGGEIDGCGSGSRVGRGVIDLVEGGSITFVNVHGSSGLTADDMDCRVRQFELVFVDLGDGEPAANGAVNVVVGDLNTDPGRLGGDDPSAARFTDFVGDGHGFHFISDVGEDAPPSYQDLLNIDHVASDAYDGSCWVAGLTDGQAAVIDAVYFDHKPVVCDLEGPLP
jgi:endonuclease/exonuclease/phosphatase family metal-dependent hydrolase